MKIMLKSLTVFVFLLVSTVNFGQNNTLETETAFMNCIYSALPDEGVKFKKILDKAEQRLIELNYLKDANGMSYVSIYKNMSNMFSENLRNLGVANYMAKIAKSIDTPEMSKCMEGVFGVEAFKTSKISKMLIIMQTINQYPDGDSLTSDILKILDPVDFKHDYYRMTTFTMIEAMNQTNNSGLSLEIPDKVEANFTEEELKNALRIKIQADQKVTINDEEIAIEFIQREVATYLKKNKSKSALIIETSREANYGNFAKVQTQVVAAFDALREELAQEKHNKSFSELSATAQEEIKKIYPLRIIENHEE